MKILVVEDHAPLADITCRVLRDVYGHEVDHAASGAGAFEAFQKLHPELVLIDINLPDMNGFQVAQGIRRLPDSDSTLVVAVSGFGTTILDEEAQEAGFDAHFRKPMDFDLIPSLRRRSRF